MPHPCWHTRIACAARSGCADCTVLLGALQRAMHTAVDVRRAITAVPNCTACAVVASTRRIHTLPSGMRNFCLSAPHCSTTSLSAPLCTPFRASDLTHCVGPAALHRWWHAREAGARRGPVVRAIAASWQSSVDGRVKGRPRTCDRCYVRAPRARESRKIEEPYCTSSI